MLEHQRDLLLGQRVPRRHPRGRAAPVGTAFSQTSGRYVRSDEISYYVPGHLRRGRPRTGYVHRCLPADGGQCPQAGQRFEHRLQALLTEGG